MSAERSAVSACGDENLIEVFSLLGKRWSGRILGVLIEARTKLANRRGFLLASPGLETKRALEVSGLDRHFAVHDTVDAALSTSL